MIKQYIDDQDLIESNIFHFKGELRLKETKSEMNYQLHNITRTNNHSITDFLDKVYLSPSPQIKISIKQLDNLHLIERQGELYKNKDKYKVYDYFIGEYPLGAELFELADKNAILEIYMEHLDIVNVTENTEAVGNSNEQQQSKQIIA